MDFLFKDLCTFFETFKKVSRGSEKGSYLRNYIRECKAKIALNSKSNEDYILSFYGLLKLILPSCDRDRAPYGIKEFKFARVITRMLCLPPKSSDAMQLSSFRISATRSVKDFAEAAYYVLQKYFTTSTDVRVEEIHKLLDIVADQNANNNPRGVEDAVMVLFKRCGSAELQKWIIRIMLKDMHLGMGHKEVLNALHPDGAELYANSNSLLDVCKLAYSEKRLLDIQISVFKPFNPMLCKTCNSNVFVKELPNKSVLYIENKFDGERFQLHMQDGNFRYFSRNGYDYTSKFGATYGEGIFTPQLKNVFKTTVKSIILDGEMMGYNKQTKKFGSKGMLFDVKTLTANANHQPCYCVFDILFLNGDVLMNETLEKRISILKEIIEPKEGVILLSKVQQVTCKEEVLNCLNAAVDKEEEGIVVKLPNSIYKPGIRANYWWKVKLEFFEGHMTDLDVLIIGGFYGDGRNHKRITSFLLAVYDEIEDTFKAFARISSGLSDTELNSLDKRLANFWNYSNFAAAKTSGIVFGSQTPDVWIEPKNSCVLEVRGSEIIKTSQGLFSTGYTLRFPRILHIRTDKPHKDILTVSELNALTLENKAVLKLTKTHVTLEDIENLIKLTRPRRKKVFSEPVVDVAEVKTGILKNYEFCVLSGTIDWPKEEVQKAILENGGNITLTESTRTLCLLAKDDDLKVAIFKDIKSKHDIVKLQWLRRVLENGEFSHYQPSDCLYMSESLKVKNMFMEDRFGDSFMDYVTISSIEPILKNVEQSGEYIRLQWDEPVRKILCRPLTFSNFIAYFDKYEIINNDSSSIIYDSFLDEMEFLFHGGELFGKLQEIVNVVVIKNEERRRPVELYLQNNRLEQVEVLTAEALRSIGLKRA